MKKRNPLLIILFSIITLGIYFMYWFYVTTKDMEEVAKKGIKPWVWTVSLIVPIWNFITFWKFSHLAEELTDKNVNGIAGFLFFIFFYPGALYLIQDTLNTKFNGGAVKVGETLKVEEKKVDAVPIDVKAPVTGANATTTPKVEEEGPEIY